VNCEFGCCRTNEKLVREQRMPGVLRDDADRQTPGRIGPAEAVEDEQLAACGGLDQARQQAVELLGGKRLVGLAPIHALVGPVVVHQKFVTGRAARVLPGRRRQRAHA